MQSYDEKLGCPKCGYQGIIALFSAKGSSTICRRCGYHESHVDDRNAKKIIRFVDIADQNEGEQLAFL